MKHRLYILLFLILIMMSTSCVTGQASSFSIRMRSSSRSHPSYGFSMHRQYSSDPHYDRGGPMPAQRVLIAIAAMLALFCLVKIMLKVGKMKGGARAQPAVTPGMQSSQTPAAPISQHPAKQKAPPLSGRWNWQP